MRSSQPPTSSPVEAQRTANARVGPPARHCAAQSSYADSTDRGVDRRGHQPNRRAVSSSSPAACTAASAVRCPERITPSPRSVGAAPSLPTGYIPHYVYRRIPHLPPQLRGPSTLSRSDLISGHLEPKLKVFEKEIHIKWLLANHCGFAHS